MKIAYGICSATIVAWGVLAINEGNAADSILISNPSFEDNSNPVFPGYGPISGWTGGSGTNDAAGPFADNGVIPDRGQVAFLQGNATLSQNVSGLQVGHQYWVQGYVNSRAGDTDDPLATVSYNGSPLIPPTLVPPAGNPNPYYFINIPFVPAVSSGALAVSSAPSVGGDASLLVDGISLIRRGSSNLIIQNPSFEASGSVPTFPGYSTGAGNGPIAGWTFGNPAAAGINPGASFGPFTDNGAIPDGARAAFLQGTNSVSQLVGGFVAGENYVLTYRENARTPGPLSGSATVGGNTVVAAHNVNPVGGANPYKYVGSSVFTAATGANTLSINSTVNVGDQTLLVDNVKIQKVKLAFSDNFNSIANSNDINPGVNSLPGRQGGSTAPLNYTDTAVADNFTQVNNGEYPQALLIAAGFGVQSDVRVSPNYDFRQMEAEGGQFVVQYDVNPTSQGDLSSWAASVIGSTQNAFLVGQGGVGFLIRGNGGFQIFDNTVGAVLELDGIAGSLTPDANGYYQVRINYEVPGFGSGLQNLVAISVNGVLLHSFQTRGGFLNNYITLIGEADTGNATHGFDNLQVWAIPEPASLVLFSVGLAAWIGVRRRVR